MRFAFAVLVLLAVGCSGASTPPKQQTYAEALDVYSNERDELARLRAREMELQHDMAEAEKHRDGPGATKGFPEKVKGWYDETQKSVDAQTKRVEAAKKAKEDAWARENR